MTAHDPALVERLTAACNPLVEASGRNAVRSAHEIALAVLDFLAAEGWLLVGPTVEIVDYLNERARARGLPEDPAVRMARIEDERDVLAAEVERLRAALAEVIEVLRTSRGAGDAARVAREALAESTPREGRVGPPIPADEPQDAS